MLTRGFLVVWLSGWANFLAVGAVNPLLPRFVKDDLGYGDVAVGLVVAAIAVSAVVVRPSAGRLADRRGRRWVAIVGAATTAGSFALYAVPHLAVLVPARLLTGAGQAMFFTGAGTIVTELAPEHRRGEAVSYFSVAVFLGVGTGAAVGEWVEQTWSISAGFLAAALLGVLATAVSSFVAETGGFLAHVVTGTPVKRINRAALLPGCVLALGMVGNLAISSFMPLYADDLGMGSTAAIYLLYSAVIIIVRLFGARLPDVLGPNLCGTAATIVITAGLATVALSGRPWGLYVGAVTLAAGISFLYPALMSLVLGRTAVQERSSAVATFTMFQDVASGVGAVVLGVVASAAGYRASFGAAAASALLGLVLLRLVVLAPPAVTSTAVNDDGATEPVSQPGLSAPSGQEHAGINRRDVDPAG